jgi:3-dehydroquinate synthase II
MVDSVKDVIVEAADEVEVGHALNQMAELGLTKLLVRKPLAVDARLQGITTIGVSGTDVLITDAEKQGGPGTAAIIEIRNSKDVERAVRAGERGHAFIIVSCRNWVIIPLENLVAEFSRIGRRLYAMLEDGQEVDVLFTVLERGVDGVVVPAAMLSRTKERLRSIAEKTPLGLSKARVIRISDAGLGERACVDTTSTLNVGEGMLVGSMSSFFFLVHSETIPGEYIPTRPFRVNAGAIHSYVLGGDDRTRYLSELKSGDTVQIVDCKGNRRVVTVGRIKIERRPLVMVVAKVGEGEEGSVMLQKAETVRLVKPDSTPVAATGIKEGDDLLVHLAARKGRHFGGSVDEFILER